MIWGLLQQHVSRSNPIDKDQLRPVIKISGLDALVDTGAETCVCNLPAAIIPAIFTIKSQQKDYIYGLCEKKDTKEEIEKCKIKGTTFVVGDFQIERLHFKNLKLFVPDNRLVIAQKFIIGADVWRKFVCTIDPFEHEITLKRLQDDLIIDMDA